MQEKRTDIGQTKQGPENWAYAAGQRMVDRCRQGGCSEPYEQWGYDVRPPKIKCLLGRLARGAWIETQHDGEE